MEAARKLLADYDCVLSQIQIHGDNINGVMRADPPVNVTDQMTERERDVLILLAKGFSYSESSEFLGCGVSTVQTHVKRIYRKLNVNSKSEAVFEALKLSLIEL